MKRILVALSICLFAPACVDDTVGPAADPAAESSAPVDPGAPADEVPVPRELSAVPSCTARCAEAYDDCLSRADSDPISVCLCFNANVFCRRSCGIPGFPRKC